jgi:hypothetical protein
MAVSSHRSARRVHGLQDTDRGLGHHNGGSPDVFPDVDVAQALQICTACHK